jgi:hypothetical protein
MTTTVWDAKTSASASPHFHLNVLPGGYIASSGLICAGQNIRIMSFDMHVGKHDDGLVLAPRVGDLQVTTA